MPVAQKMANGVLEAAYMKAAANPGEPLLVAIDGRPVTRPRIKGRKTFFP
jgi:hypothetical protein